MRVHTSFTIGSVALLAFFSQLVLAADSSCPIVGPTPPKNCDGSDGVWFPVSVAGRGTYCTLGPEICVAQSFAACPGPAADLPFGAKCKQLETKVYGCVPKTSCSDGELGDITEAPTPNPTATKRACEGRCAIDPSTPGTCDGKNGWYPVSVVGAGVFCVQGPVCAADLQAACPGPQHGLPFGSSCARIPSGVFGCVENDKCQMGCGSPAIGSDTACNTASDAASPPQVTTVVPTSTPTEMPTSAPTPSSTSPSTSSATPTQLTPSTGPSSAPSQPSTSVPSTSSTPASSTTSPSPTDDLNSFVPDDSVDDDNMSLLPVPDLVDTFTIGSVETSSAPQSSESASIPVLNPARHVRRQ